VAVLWLQLLPPSLRVNDEPTAERQDAVDVAVVANVPKPLSQAEMPDLVPLLAA